MMHTLRKHLARRRRTAVVQRQYRFAEPRVQLDMVSAFRQQLR